MKVAKGNASKEAQEIKRFIGVVPVTVKAVNPNKKETEELFGTTLEEEPVYIQDREDANGKPYKSVRISIVLEPNSEWAGFDMPLITMSMFISNQKTYGATSGKYKIIDKYGRTAWATEAEIQNKQIPVYSNGKQADIDKDYRIMCVGEEEIISFIKSFLCIPNITVWDNNTKSMIPNKGITPELCECGFEQEDLIKLFKGDFSGIREILAYQPNNYIKVCLGVRTDPNSGRLYQTVYTKKFISNATTNYSSLEKALQEDITYAQQHNKALNTEYSAKSVQEYSVIPTTFTPSAPATGEEDLPFDVPSASDSIWG